MDQEQIMLSEINETKAKYYMISLMWNLKQNKGIKQQTHRSREQANACQMGRGWRMRIKYIENKMYMYTTEYCPIKKKKPIYSAVLHHQKKKRHFLKTYLPTTSGNESTVGFISTQKNPTLLELDPKRKEISDH